MCASTPNPETLAPSARVKRRAIKTDPTLPDDYIWLARVSNGIVAYGWSDDPDADLSEGMQAALRGVQLDERNPYSHYALAIISVFSGSS